MSLLVSNEKIKLTCWELLNTNIPDQISGCENKSLVKIKNLIFRYDVRTPTIVLVQLIAEEVEK